MSSSLQPFTLQQTHESIRLWPFFLVDVGSDPFSVSFDTHSSLTWLYSTSIPDSNRNGRNVYNPKVTTPSCGHCNTITYGDSLRVDVDRAYLEELGFGKTTQADQMIFGASSVVAKSGIGQSDLMEGILALGPRYPVGSTSLTVWAKLATALPKPVFMTDLRFNGRGEYTFGTIPYRKKDINFWQDKDEQDLWRLPVTSYAIGGHGMEMKIGEACFHATVDTGCSSLRLPASIVQSYYAVVPSHTQRDGVYYFPIRQVLPDLWLYFGKRRYEVKIPGMFLKPQGVSDDADLCRSRLEESTAPYGPILGHPFFFAQNVIFKGVDALSVGLVRKEVQKRPSHSGPNWPEREG